MSSHPRHIPLDRHFKQLQANASAAYDPWESYIADIGGYWGATHDWAKLLEHPGIVVVLGEPGLGKTWEFRRIVEEQMNSGRPAFFLPLERLAREQIGQILDPEIADAFTAWKTGDEPAWFLLDSVDEAKLTKVSDFYAALDRLRAELGGSIRRAHIILSSRISEWRPETDRAEVLERIGHHLAMIEKKGSEDNRVLVVEMMPLDRKRVSTFAHARCEGDAEAFLSEVDRRHAWEFAGRPLDVLLLISYWKTHTRLGTLTETLEYLVTEQLRESQERKERSASRPLSADRARLGAEYLAATSLLCRRVSFYVPDDAHATSKDALRVHDCLPADWTEIERLALIDRPLFDSASYGRIRFHHRRVAEYLAACWLKRRMQMELPWSDLEQLFFDKRKDRCVLKPSLSSVAAWFVSISQETWSLRLRQSLLEHAPQVFLQSGDPEQLGTDFKRVAVDHFVRAFRDCEWRRPDTDLATLSRLSDSAVASQLSAHVLDTSIADYVRIELIRIVGQGRLEACKPALITVLRDESSAPVLKALALRSLHPMATSKERDEVAEIATQWDELPEVICGDLMEVIFPDNCTPTQWGTLLRKMEPERDYDTRRTTALFGGVTSVTDEVRLNAILREIEAVLVATPHIDEDSAAIPMSRDYAWLSSLAADLLIWLLERPKLTQWQTEWAGRMVWRITHARFHGVGDSSRESFGKETMLHPEVRRIAYWLAAKDEKPNAQKPGMFSWVIACNFNFPLNMWPSNTDLVWLLDDSRHRPSVAEQVSCLFVALRYGQKWSLRERAQILHASLRWPHFKDYLWWQWIWLRNTVMGPFYRAGFNSPLRGYWWKRLPKKIISQWYRVRWRWWLLRYQADYRCGKRCGLLRGLINESGHEEGVHRCSSVNWGKLEKLRGLRVVRDLRSGCIRVWHEHTPDAHGESDGYPDLGLIGLHETIKANERFFETLSSDDAYRAALYATHEDNSLAEWLPLLAIQYPDEVVRALTRSLRVEWGNETAKGKYPKVLHSLAHQQDSITKLMTPLVSELLSTREPEDHSTLESALKVLACGDGFSTVEWAYLAKSRIQHYGADDRQFIDWLAIWLDADAPVALEFMEQSLPNFLQDDETAAVIFAGLSGSMIAQSARLRASSLHQVDNLVRMLRLVYRWIAPKDDVHRETGVVLTVGPRDQAQSYRWRLVSHLAERPEPEAEAALEMLITEPPFQSEASSIRYLLEKRIESNADGQPIEPADVLAFGADLEFVPRTMAELFALVCKRLQVIKEAVEIPDSASLRSAVQAGNDEAHLRTFLASELNRRSRQLYRAEQEAEIDQAQRPDLRAIHPAIPGAVPIEVKLADKGWTLAKLLERLETQLVGQYLRAPECMHGIFVLGIADDRHWVSAEMRERLTFAQVIDRLQERARELEQQFRDSGVDAIRVIGIDFRASRLKSGDRSLL